MLPKAFFMEASRTRSLAGHIARPPPSPLDEGNNRLSRMRNFLSVNWIRWSIRRGVVRSFASHRLLPCLCKTYGQKRSRLLPNRRRRLAILAACFRKTSVGVKLPRRVAAVKEKTDISRPYGAGSSFGHEPHYSESQSLSRVAHSPLPAPMLTAKADADGVSLESVS